MEIVRNFASGGGEANVYGSSYYWNFRTSSFKQVACLIFQALRWRFDIWEAIFAVKKRWYVGT